MSMNRNMRVLVANGYFDLATPHFGSTSPSRTSASRRSFAATSR
jgi:hypothetical protein